MTAYLDNAASTAPLPEVVEAVSRAMREHFANPSSLHGLGAAAARALASAREEVAALVHAEPEAIVFTGSGTEANALGLVGAARASRKRHIVVSAIEHAAVFDSAQRLLSEGWQVDWVAPEGDGCVTAESVLAAVTSETAVVSIMLVNNEIGTLQPVADIARGLRTLGRKIHFHIDAVQFAGIVHLDVRTKGADSIAISAHKLHGPKGTGALWLRKGATLAPLTGTREVLNFLGSQIPALRLLGWKVQLEGKAATLHNMAGVRVTRGDLEGALALYDQSLAIEEALGNMGGKAVTLSETANGPPTTRT